MRMTEDSNAREALQFMALTVSVLVVIALVIGMADRWVPEAPSRAVDHVLMRFRAGYILREPGILVSGAWPRLVRLCFAGCTALIIGLGITLLLRLVPPLRDQAWRVGRWTLGAAAIWGVIAVLFLPPRSASAIPNGLRIIERPALFGQLSLPFPQEVVNWERGTIASIRTLEGGAFDTLRISPINGPDLDLLVPEDASGGNAFVAAALYDHLR